MSTLPPDPWLRLRPEVAERLSRRVEERMERQEAMWRMMQGHAELIALVWAQRSAMGPTIDTTPPPF